MKLTVISDHGTAVPPNGYNNYDKDTLITCTVSSPVTENGTVWECKGWSGTGSVPATGKGTAVTFPVAGDSTITWIWKKQWLSPAQIASVITLVVIIVLAVLFYETKYALPMVVFAGAIGGLMHEIVQSQGKYIVPTTDSTGNFCLGGLIGVITGAVAGFILYSGFSATSAVSVSGWLFTEAFLAGLAAKGVADAVNPPPANPPPANPPPANPPPANPPPATPAAKGADAVTPPPANPPPANPPPANPPPANPPPATPAAKGADAVTPPPANPPPANPPPANPPPATPAAKGADAVTPPPKTDST